MIKMARPRRAPASLDSDAARCERERARDHFAAAGRRAGKFAFRAYKAGDVVAVFETAFAGKCAYCESFYLQGNPVEVEHFRPKSAVSFEVTTGAKTRRPTKIGYYWLASEWSNLLPSCVDCNRRRWQRIHAVGMRMSGKGALFPLVDGERTRARSRRSLGRERPMLINPTIEAPQRYLHFLEDGTVEPATMRRSLARRRAEDTIRIFGLNRDGLVEARRRHLTGTVLPTLLQVRILLDRLEITPTRREPRDDLLVHFGSLKDWVFNFQAPFRAATRDVVTAYLERLGLRVKW